MTKMETSGARIRALTCIKASTPNRIKAANRTTIPRFIRNPPFYKNNVNIYSINVTVKKVAYRG